MRRKTGVPVVGSGMAGRSVPSNESNPRVELGVKNGRIGRAGGVVATEDAG